MYSDEDEIERFCYESYQNQRRLCRLYGSKTKNLKLGRIQNEKENDNDHPSESDKKKKCANNTVQKCHESNNESTCNRSNAVVQKFFDRKLNEIDVEIHADNFNINQPWFVGYQNSTSSQGSPLSLAARYGYNGAIRIAKASRRPEDVGVISGQSPIHGGNDDKEEGKIEIQGCEDLNTCSKNAENCCRTNDINTKQLDRAISRECALWQGITTNAKNERKRKNKLTRRFNEVKLSKYCPKSISMKHSCVKSHKVFSMG